MKTSIALLIVLILSACAVAPVELPDWDLAKPSDEPVTDAKELPILCEISSTGTWNASIAECWAIFEQYEEIAEFNYVAAQGNATGLRNAEAATLELIEAAKVQQQLSQIRQQMLERERRAHFLDNWFYRILIGLGLLGAVL